MRVRALMTTGQSPEIVKAVENELGTFFIDTLGKRWSADQVISIRPIVGMDGEPLP